MYDNYRYGFMEPLLQWAVNSGVEFSPGTEIVADEFSDWGMELVESKERGTPILTVPSELVLTSQNFQGTQLERWMQDNIGHPYYLPECILATVLLEELSEGSSSPWYVWLESLPTEFSTGIFLDSFERSIVRRIAPTFLAKYEEQWNNFQSLIVKLSRDPQSILNPAFRRWLQSQDNLILTAQWAFTIVATRSWRTPDGKHATIVPIGDMLNHDTQRANIRPCFGQNDGAIQLCLTIDTSGTSEEPQGIYLCYGMAHQPARFLVNFGFCDKSSPLIDAHIDRYLANNSLPPLSDEKEWPAFDPSCMVVSSKDGVVSEDVWKIFLLKILRERDPSQIRRIQDVYDSEDDENLDETLVGLLDDWELVVALEMKEHFKEVLENVYPQFQYSDSDFLSHSLLKMILMYNTMMREVYGRAIDHLDLVIDQCSKDLARSNQGPTSTRGDPAAVEL